MNKIMIGGVDEELCGESNLSLLKGFKKRLF